MAASEEISSTWTEGSEDELVKELLDDESPFFLLPKTLESKPNLTQEPLKSLFLSTLYSGPTITDIASALATNCTNSNSFKKNISHSAISMTDKGLSKMDNKYTLKIKSCGNTMAEDGYKWRKYGQKSIKNSPNPRSYYRCTNPRCNAKKQVERSIEDPETLIITYEGLHLHFAHSFFPILTSNDSTTHHPPKRLKIQNSITQDTQTNLTKQVGSTLVDPTDGGPSYTPQPQGLLEDVVPLLIRNPLNNSTSSSDPCFSSLPSSPPYSSSSSSFSWSPNSSFSEVAIPSSN